NNVFGLDQLEAKFSVLINDIGISLDRELPEIGNELDTRMKIKLTGERHGWLYIWREAKDGETPDSYRRLKKGLIPIKYRSVPHRASAPGEPPALDTGALRKSVEPDVDRANRTVTLYVGGYEAPYAEDLEFGNLYVEPRPFMFGTLDVAEPTITNVSIGGVN